MYFFTADEHYHHSNIIKYQNRPFRDIIEHDEKMISNSNEVVGTNDTVIHAGDFCWFKKYIDHNSHDDAYSYIRRLNGNHVFLEGDHDKWMKGVNRRQQIWRKIIDKQYIVVCHYALHTWPRSHYNSWHLYGHTHHDLNLPGKRHCISVENTNYYPLSFDQIKEIMSRKDNNPNYIKPEDRHTQ
jgi:calcineurin-like phosphoesterase family protein